MAVSYTHLEPFSGPDWGGETLREPWERYSLVGGEHKKYLDPACANLFALKMCIRDSNMGVHLEKFRRIILRNIKILKIQINPI